MSALSQAELEVDSLSLGSPRPSPSPQCFIASLPEELLLQIFSHLPPETFRPFYRYGEPDEDIYPYPLLLVCKNWRRLYEIELFRTIQVLPDRPRRREKLMMHLDTYPHLRKYPRHFYIHRTLTDTVDTTLDTIRALNYCSLLTDVRLVSCGRIYWHGVHHGNLVILTDVVDRVAIGWNFVKAVQTLPHLTNLHLGGASLYLASQFFNLPTIKSITLSECGSRISPEDRILAKGKEREDPRYRAEDALGVSNYHTGSMTKLTWTAPEGPASLLTELLRFPASLKSLSLEDLLISNNSTKRATYNTQAIQAAMDIHDKSLEHVRLGMIEQQFHMPDFSQFQCLEKIEMSAYNCMTPEQPATTVLRKLPLSLRFLSLYSAPEDQYVAIDVDFGEEGLKWMTKFAFVKKTKYPGSKLEKIYFHYKPHWYPDYDEERQGLEPFYPWEYLEKTKEILSDFGLQVEYSEPRCTRMEWEKERERWPVPEQRYLK